ncbi:MAG: LPS export ABC transporter ATP-binding protein, partial [Chitinivibrionales bacterium]|nr:LPS export ABC transporter ATP-binding protein [Chitinivibrionales bacterium]
MSEQTATTHPAVESKPAHPRGQREIRTDGLVKIYSKRRVVDSVAISVRQAEIVGRL